MKKNIINLLQIFVIASVLLTAFVYGEDREMARQDFEREWNNGNHEATITGCIFQSNCKYYTDLLKK